MIEECAESRGYPMGRVHITINHLLGLILGISLALIGLREATDFWLGVAVAGTLLWVGIAFRRAFSASGRRTIFWRGMTAGGLAYLLLSCGPWAPTIVEPWLPSTKLLASLLSDRQRQPKYRISWHDARGNTICSTDIYGDRNGKPLESKWVVRSLTVAESGSALGNCENGAVVVRQTESKPFRLICHLEVGFCIAIVAGSVAESIAPGLSTRSGTTRPAPGSTPSFPGDHAGA